MSATSSALVQFRSREGQDTGPQLTIPVDVNIEQLNLLVNRLLSNVRISGRSIALLP